jgi:uncharacterized protein (DUF1800 family)
MHIEPLMASLNPISGALGKRRAAHFLRRTSFRYTRKRVDELALLTAQAAFSDVFVPAPLLLDQPVYGSANITWVDPPLPPTATVPDEESVLRRYVMAWWLHEALHDPGAGHKMEFFLHQYLSVSYESGTSGQFFDYLRLLRWGAFGNYKKIATKIVLDNCMLNYINNNLNYVNNPNENFAREFFELHTIGKGDIAGPGDYTTFTEDDIVQAARVLTGFGNAQRHLNTDMETMLPAGKPFPQSHDFDPKVFSARFNGATINALTNDADGMMAELDSFVDMLFEQEATSLNICRRLYRFFVTRKISAEVETDIIGPLAQTLRDNDFEMLPVLQQLLLSQHFYDEDDNSGIDEIYGAFIKSPLDLTMHALSYFEVPIPDPLTDNDTHYNTFYNAAVLERMLSRTGMDLFYPPDVAGYPGYYQDPVYNRMFFNSASIVGRYKLPEILMTGTHAWVPSPNEPIGTRLDFALWIKESDNISNPSDSTILVRELLIYLFPEEPDNERFTHFVDVVFLDGLLPEVWTYEWENYAATGDDTEVSIPLRRLLNAIMYAPEYQLF